MNNLSITIYLNDDATLHDLQAFLDQLDGDKIIVESYDITLGPWTTEPQATTDTDPRAADRRDADETDYSTLDMPMSDMTPLSDAVEAAMEAARQYTPYAPDVVKDILDRIADEDLAATTPAPPTKKLRGLADFPCKSCGAKRNEPCVTTRGKNIGRIYRGYMHDARYDARTRWIHNLGGE